MDGQTIETLYKYKTVHFEVFEQKDRLIFRVIIIIIIMSCL